MDNVQKVCHFNNIPSSQTFRIYLKTELFASLRATPLKPVWKWRLSKVPGILTLGSRASREPPTKIIQVTYEKLNIIILRVDEQRNKVDCSGKYAVAKESKLLIVLSCKL
jgi:hypothetical protein